jgi:primosomal protein N' (replication factor Y) (superfamily II helicase)
LPDADTQPTAATVVRVAVPKPLPRQYDYRLAPDQPAPAPGARVRVHFGRQRLVGVCTAVDPPDAHPDLAPLDAVLDQQPVLEREVLELGFWLSDYYHCPLGEVLAALLPAAARRGADLGERGEPLWRVTDARPDLRRAPRQQALLDHVLRSGGAAPARSITDAGYSGAVLRGLAAKGVLVRERQPVGTATAAERPRVPEGETAPWETGPELNAEQRRAVDLVRADSGRFSVTLLDGVTGSGKTEVYLRVIQSIRTAGRQVLVLVPEIALTPQTLDRFRRRFGAADTVHSAMTDAQRLAVWQRCRDGTAGILIGTRSAVLTPFRDLGLIVVDEEHDGSFKQQDGLRYSARDVAVKRAQTLGIPLLLGSATPSLESLANAAAGRYRQVHLRERAGGATMPAFHLLDIRGHTLDDGISDRLQRILRSHLDADGQALVFLNRRGYAPVYLCPGCGWQATCPRCDVRMTLHRQPPALLCHHCGRRERVPTACPACGRAELLAVGMGTQRTESALARAFPDVPIHRIDRDTTRSQRRLEAQLRAIQTGERAILIGTQMLAKGHHFPNVTLVAVINADSGFLSADFRAPERTAQLIVQVAGRAGRAERPGEVWIQTYQPDNPMLQALISEGYPGFARRELDNRRNAGLPPFRPMALIRAEGTSTERVQALLRGLQQNLRDAAAGKPGNVEVLGPVAAPLARRADRVRQQLLVLADARKPLHQALRAITADPPRQAGVRWSVDVDPYDTF